MAARVVGSASVSVAGRARRMAQRAGAATTTPIGPPLADAVTVSSVSYSSRQTYLG